MWNYINWETYDNGRDYMLKHLAGIWKSNVTQFNVI